MGDNTKEVMEIIEVIEEDAEYISKWESNFIAGLKKSGGPFTTAQHNKIIQIHEQRINDAETYDNEIY